MNDLSLDGLMQLRQRWIENKYFHSENHVGEIKVSRIRLIGLAVFYLNECWNVHIGAVSERFHFLVSLEVLLWTFAAFALWYLTAVRRWYHPLIQFVSTTLDMVLLSTMLLIGGRDLSQIFVVFYLLIALGGIRYSAGVTVFAGFFGAACYAAVAYANDMAALGRVDWLELTLRVLAMLVLAIITGHVVINNSSLMLRFVDQELRSERIKDTLARYVSTQVAEEILKDRGEFLMVGDRRVVTILMSDLRGFTTLSERIPAEQVVAILNDYFSRMIDIIFHHRGTLDKFIGDAILAVYGAPVPMPDHAALAVRTAIEMQRALAAFNRERAARGEEEIHMGIGINSGEVVAGNIGSEKRLEYTVIGDPVNLTQRIESQSKRGEILVTEETRRQVQDLFQFEELPEMKVKGRIQPIKVYRVLYS